MDDDATPWTDPICLALHRPGAVAGALSGTTFAAKDLFDVAGEITGAGNPTWAAQASPAEQDAPTVTALLAAGSTLVGKTVTDELAFSLAGTNAHYGTPPNPAAPGRMPGGSSAGSASAVAAGRCDIALGTDTGGSVRVPASYCGIWGMRPTHGRIPTDRIVPLAPSFDTVGWFARDARRLADAGSALLGLGASAPTTAIRRILVVDELTGLADPTCLDPLLAAAGQVASAAGIPLVHAGADVLRAWWGPPPAEGWLGAFRTIQTAEAWAIHGAWLATDPPMGAGVRSRFAAGRAVTAGQLAAALAVREGARRALEAVVGDGTALAIPAASGVAPPLDITPTAKEDLRARTLTLTCGPGLAGLPVVSAPLARDGDLPIGLCLVGAPWWDEALLALAVRVETA